MEKQMFAFSLPRVERRENRVIPAEAGIQKERTSGFPLSRE
jgi:hypothetical protein